MPGENWTFWLNMTNLALGIVTALAVLVVIGAVGWELSARVLRKTRETDKLHAEMWAMLHGAQTFSVPELGLTMADGGEVVQPSETGPSDRPRRK